MLLSHPSSTFPIQALQITADAEVQSSSQSGPWGQIRDEKRRIGAALFLLMREREPQRAAGSKEEKPGL